MKFDDLCKRINETTTVNEDVSVNEHTEKVLEALINKGLLSEDSCDLVDE
jgi:hypothetical protein